MENRKRKNQRVRNNTVSVPTQLIRNWIKFHLKEQRLTYATCAKVLGVSLATMKRLMNESDFTLSQACQISDWIEIPISELLNSVPVKKATLTEFTLKQEAFLSQNPKAFYALVVVMKGGGCNEVAKELRIPTQEAKTILYQLDRIDVINIFPGDRFRVASMGPFKWRASGDLEKTYLRKFYSCMGQKVLQVSLQSNQNKLKDENFLLKPFEFYLKLKTYNEFQQKMRDIIMEFHLRAIVEASSTTYDNIRPVSGLVFVSDFNAWKNILSPID